MSVRSYDGFARVAMSMGTNQLILGLHLGAILQLLFRSGCGCEVLLCHWLCADLKQGHHGLLVGGLALYGHRNGFDSPGHVFDGA